MENTIQEAVYIRTSVRSRWGAYMRQGYRTINLGFHFMAFVVSLVRSVALLLTAGLRVIKRGL
jgi:hypothetical protein